MLLMLWWAVAVMTFMMTIIVPPMLMLLRSPTVFVGRDDPGQDRVDGFEVRASSSVDVNGPWSRGHVTTNKSFRQ